MGNLRYGLGLYGMRLSSICDKACIGLGYYRLNGPKKERNELLDKGLRIYELLQTGSKLKDYNTKEERLAYEAHRRLTAFCTSPENLEKVMKDITLAKKAIEQMKNDEKFSDEDIRKYQRIFITLGSIFLREDLTKLRAMEEPYLDSYLLT